MTTLELTDINPFSILLPFIKNLVFKTSRYIICYVDRTLFGMFVSFVLLVFTSFIIESLEIMTMSSLSSCNSTEYEQPFQRIIKRRKRRGIIFPSGSSILVTHAITKVMTGATPKGLSVSYELDIYFPLPDTLEGLFPKKKVSSKQGLSRIDISNKQIQNISNSYLSSPVNTIEETSNDKYIRNYFQNSRNKEVQNANLLHTFIYIRLFFIAFTKPFKLLAAILERLQFSSTAKTHS